MKELSKYKIRKIAHYYLDTNSIWWTVRKFKITYKTLYKIIETSRILSFRKVNWETKKICSSCGSLLPYTEEYFYKRKSTKYLYSSCKKCMWLLSRTYKIINKDKISWKNKISSKIYYNKNILIIKEKKQKHYKKNKNKLLANKKKYYIASKVKFFKLLFK